MRQYELYGQRARSERSGRTDQNKRRKRVGRQEGWRRARIRKREDGRCQDGTTIAVGHRGGSGSIAASATTTKTRISGDDQSNELCGQVTATTTAAVVSVATSLVVSIRSNDATAEQHAWLGCGFCVVCHAAVPTAQTVCRHFSVIGVLEHRNANIARYLCHAAQ